LPLCADCDRVGKPVSKRWLALGYTARIFEWPRGLTVKNWTLRQRILASFAVIIAIMLLMVVVSYSRLLKIEVSEEKVRTDSVPGVYASSMIRSAWVDSYVLTQQIVGLSENHPISTEDQLRFKEFEQRLVKEMASYQATVFDKDDQAAFDDFERRHQTYNQILTKVLDLYQRKDFSQAQQVLQLDRRAQAPQRGDREQ
jgi:methyl-accepting chemotaxis protein WspA